jgi:hypothetical protein
LRARNDRCRPSRIARDFAVARDPRVSPARRQDRARPRKRANCGASTRGRVLALRAAAPMSGVTTFKETQMKKQSTAARAVAILKDKDLSAANGAGASIILKGGAGCPACGLGFSFDKLRDELVNPVINPGLAAGIVIGS